MFKEVIGEKEVARVGPSPIGLVSLREEKDHVKTQGEGGHLQAEKRGPRRNQTFDTWPSDLFLPAPRRHVSVGFAGAAPPS